MAAYSSPENLARHASLDNYLSLTREALTDPALTRVLPKLTSHFTHILDTMVYVANIRGGIAKTPQEYKNHTSIPIIGLAEGQHVDISTPSILTMHQQQRERLKVFTQELPLTYSPEQSFQFIDESSRKSSRILSIKLPQGVLGLTTEPHIPFIWTNPTTHTDEQLRFYTRPIMTFPVDTAPSALRAATVIHELTHVAHALDRVVSSIDPTQDSLRLQQDELKAYHIEVAAIHSLFYQSKNRLFKRNMQLKHPLALSIETARRQVNDQTKDDFTPSHKIRDKVLQLTGFDLAQYNFD